MEINAIYSNTINGMRKIMVVDDEKTVRTAFSLMIRHLGFETIEVDKGENALEIYAENTDEIDLVILDLFLPDLSGYEILKKLKSINPDAKILLSSGSFTDTDSENLIDGCAGNIRKPICLERLSAVINKALSKNPNGLPETSPSGLKGF